MSSSAFERVLAEPGSKAAREALLAEWRAAGDPRAELLGKQLELAATSYADATVKWRNLSKEIRALVAARGREFAGQVADLVDGFDFKRGLVARVTLSGDAWIARAKELLALAPIQHLQLTTPIDLGKVFAVPELARIRVLDLANLGTAVGNAGAIALAKSRYAANLRFLDLLNDGIGDAGVEALAASPFLERCRYINLAGNPTNPTPAIDDIDGTRVPRRPKIAEVLEQTFGAKPWLALPAADAAYPPDADALCIEP